MRTRLVGMLVAGLALSSATPGVAVEPPHAGTITLIGTTTGQIFAFASPTLSCNQIGLISYPDVTCTATVSTPKCSEVYVEAHLIPDGSSTVTGTSQCGQLVATATAGPIQPSAEDLKSGRGNHPVRCTATVTGHPVSWGVNCDVTFSGVS